MDRRQLSLVLTLFASVTAYTLYSFSTENWIEPERVVFLEVRSNLTGTVKIGDVVEFRCKAHNHSRPEATLEWKQVYGRMVYRELAGRSELVWHKTISEKDHGSQVFCGTFYYTPELRDYVYAKSEFITLTVQGVRPKTMPDIGRVFITIVPLANSYKIGDVLQYVCNVENLKFKYPVIDMIQSKDNLERKMYVGYHVGYRWMQHNLTAADRGTQVFCKAWLLDENRRSFMMFSDNHTLNIV